MKKSKKILFKLVAFYVYCIKVISLLVPVNKNKITFIDKHYSSSSLMPVYKKIKKYFPKIKIQFIEIYPTENEFVKHLILYFKLLTSKIIITTHGPRFKTTKNIVLELWHGMPLKGLNLLTTDIPNRQERVFSNIDYLNAYSSFFVTIMNSCFGLKLKNYVILGNPRNDLLFNSKNKNKIFHLLNIKKEQKTIIYMPTFRDNVKDKEIYKQFITHFGFKDFNIQKFNQFLVKNNLKFILKPHPTDNGLWTKLFEKLDLSNIILLTEEYLIKNNLDFYEILGLSDLLITDYSSVYIDYLLINKPIIFIPTDIDQYRKDRTLLLEPYDFWTPGPKCLTEEDFKKEIIKCLEDGKYYEKERKTLLNIFHKYQDNKSTERVVQFISKLLKTK